jgi:hypothetical protein
MLGTEDALTGLGMPAQLADLCGAQPNKQAGAASSTQTGATLLTTQSVEVTAAGGANSFLLQDLGVNVPFHIFCSSSTSAVVFCPVGHNLNGSSNGSLTIAQNKAAIFWQYKKSNWTSLLTA